MRHRIDVTGSIIPNDYKDFYDWMHEDATCPRDITDVLDRLNPGDEVDVYINSPGGVIDCGSQIYTELRAAAANHDVKIYITGQACSAASVIACAGYCEMAPTALMMVHCVSTSQSGNHADMEHTAEVLRTADEAMCSAYVAKTGMSSEEALDMMEHETWLTAQQAVDAGLADGIMFDESDSEPMVAAIDFQLPTEEQMSQYREIIRNQTDIQHARAQTKLNALRLMRISSPRGQKGSNEMTKEKYHENRTALMDETQSLIDDGKIDEANARMDEVKALDQAWEETCDAQANARALMDNQPCLNVQNLTDRNAEAQIAGVTGSGVVPMANGLPEAPMTAEEAYQTDAYKTAWAKAMMNKPLTDADRDILHLVNEDFTHTTENTSVVIPETVASGIWEEIADMYPYWADIAKTYVKGKMSVIKSESSAEASWYEEDTATESVQETFGKIELNGCELSRAITVSWKLRDMAIDDFIPYIQRAMAQRMGEALGYGVTKGAGVVNGNPAEPKGIVTALLEEDGTPQVIEYTEGSLTYKDLTAARGKIKSGYTPAVYANSNTIWNVLANVLDNNGRPIFIADPMAGGVYRILGCVVKEDASFADGEILFSDAGRGYTANVNRDITVQTEEHIKARETDYCGYAIVDGAPLTQKAHALLTVGE